MNFISSFFNPLKRFRVACFSCGGVPLKGRVKEGLKRT